MRKYTLIDLFSGAGGFTHGFVEAGFKPIFAVEKEADFAETYRLNFGNHVVVGEIEKIIANGEIPKQADVVIGGPPCQGFSNLTGNRQSDPRRAMWQFFMDVVEKSKCKVFVIENVPNLLKSSEGEANSTPVYADAIEILQLILRKPQCPHKPHWSPKINIAKQTFTKP